MSDHWKSQLKGDPVPWLLESNPWTKYRTLTDLLDQPESSPEVNKSKHELRDDPRIKNLIYELSDWMPIAPTRNNDPKISYFKLRALTDFGFTFKDPGIDNIVRQAMEHIEDDMFAVRGVKPERPKKGEPFVKSDPHTDEWHISPCNSPMITYTLLALGVKDKRIDKAVEQLKDRWKTKQGWFCHYFFVNSLFNKLQVGCQMAGLMALEVFSMKPDLKKSIYANNAYDPLKFHREYGKTMYYFGRSKKFWTFKYPFVWYNALYLAEVLTRFEFLKKEDLIQELIDWIKNAQDKNGLFTPTSIFNMYKGWDFANKKEPSPWITYICCRILKRWYR